MSHRLPLQDLKVIDLTRVRAGPTCVRQLADWGADVVKIETPDDGDFVGERDGSDFQNLHRNKRSLTLNLKEPEGRAILLKMVERADIIVENYRPDVKDRLKIDYETLRRVNPRLIYASISGFGQDGPYRLRPGVDQIAQGMGGLMAITGRPGEGPMRVGIAIADVAAGLYAAMGILIAWVERQSSGEGQWVQSSLLDAQIAMLDFQAARWLLDHEIPPQVGNDHPTAIPTSAYATADGYINLAVISNPMWNKLCHVLESPELQADPRFQSFRGRSENRDFINAALERILPTRTTNEWVESLNDAGVPCGPIYTMDQVFADPQVQHNRMTEEVEHPLLGHQVLVGQAIKLSRTPSAIRCASPTKGQHTDEILRDLGYGDSEIEELKARVIV